MKYLGAITDNNDIATKGYVDGKTLDLVELYGNLDPDMITRLETEYGVDEEAFESMSASSAVALVETLAYWGQSAAMYSAGVKIATIGGVDIYVPVYNGGVS